MRRFATFAGVAGGIILGVAVVFTATLGDPEARRAVWMSALLAYAVQLATFVLLLRARPASAFGAWGAGVVVRLLTVVVFAVAGVPALALPIAPALLSLVAFLFATTLVEPVVLNKR